MYYYFSTFSLLWIGEINSNHVPHYVIIQYSVFYYRKRKWLPLDWTLLLFKCTVCVTFCYLVKERNMLSLRFGFKKSTKGFWILQCNQNHNFWKLIWWFLGYIEVQVKFIQILLFLSQNQTLNSKAEHIWSHHYV